MIDQVKKTPWDHVLISVSGGKDSSVLMLWALENFPKEKLVCVHSVIDIDWKETRGVVQSQCDFLGLPLVEVQAIHADGSEKGFLSQLTATRTNRETGEKGEYKFPDMKNRWCTGLLKRDPIHKYVRTLKGNILVLVGERREESTKRAQLEAYRPNERLSVNGRMVVDFSPILDLTEKEVWDQITASGIPVHPCYEKFGVKRASCAICIFSSKKDILQAAIHAPEIVAKYLEAEKKISHTFHYQPKTKTREEVKETVAEILTAQGFDLGKLGEVA